jgi:hypothetical protein
MADARKHPLPGLAEIKSAIPHVAHAFVEWLQTAERIESGTAAYVEVFDTTGVSSADAPPAYIQFTGGSWIEEWPEGTPGYDFPHYSTTADRSSFIAYTLAEAAWWLWVNWAWQEGSDFSREIYHAAFATLARADDGS